MNPTTNTPSREAMEAVKEIYPHITDVFGAELNTHEALIIDCHFASLRAELVRLRNGAAPTLSTPNPEGTT